MQSKFKKMCFGKAKKINSSSGFSILELLVSLVLFTIITGSIYGLLEVGRTDRNRSSRRSDVLKNARVAIHLIGRDALNSGLGYHKLGGVVPDDFLSLKLKLPVDKDDKKDLLTGIVVGDNINPNNLLANPDDRTDTIAFAFRDLDFNSGNPIELKSVTTPTAENALIETKSATGAMYSDKNDLYLLESSTSQVVVMATASDDASKITVAPNDPLKLNLAMNGTGKASSLLRACVNSDDQNCTSYAFASLKKFNLVSYKVKQDGTLVRIIYGNDTTATNTEQMQEQPLAYNVENLQFKYVLSDGRTTENPEWGADNLPGTTDDDRRNFNMVRQLTVIIKVQSTEVDEKTGVPETVTLSATFSTRNLEYDAG